MKELPATVVGILVVVFTVLPGVPGDRLYRTFVGSDWRQDQWQRALRLLSFSLFGLALYASVAPLLRTPFPGYLSPALLERAANDEVLFRRNLAALLGHFMGSAAAGAASGLGLRAIARFRSASAFYSAWDHFVRHCARDHWVILTLQNGESYSGFIETADVSVASGERDMILREPAFYDKEADEYLAMQYQSLFIPGSFLSSIATVHDPADRRIIPAGYQLLQLRCRPGSELPQARLRQPRDRRSRRPSHPQVRRLIKRRRRVPAHADRRPFRSLPQRQPRELRGVFPELARQAVGGVSLDGHAVGLGDLGDVDPAAGGPAVAAALAAVA